jgi:hypothetical protein
MRRRWEAFWVFSTGYDDSKRESIEEDSTPTRAGRRRDDSYCGRPPPERWRSSYVSPDPRHRPQSSRVQHRCPGRARQYRACQPGVFLEGDSARIINPPRPAVSSAATTPRSPGRPQPGLEAVAAVLRGQAGLPRVLLDIHLSHNVNGTRSDCSHYICSSRPLPASAPAWVKASRYPTHRLRNGDDGLPVPFIGHTPGASEDISLLPLALNIVRSE